MDTLKHKRKSKRKDKTCHVKGCERDKKQSVAADKVKDTSLKIEGSSASGNVYLCKKHWKEYKKETKEEREMKQLNWD